MGTMKRGAVQGAIEQSLEEAVTELEKVSDEIRLKLHLAGMDANRLWSETLEPRLLEARKHAREARAASKAAVQETLQALKDFSNAL